MNLLFTSAGRRGYLIRYFKEAVSAGDTIHAANSIDGVPSFKEADKCVVTPMIYDKNYIPFLLDYCQREHINALISLYDIDLPVLACHKKEFQAVGTKLIVSDESFIKICNDKWESFKFLKENDFLTPKTYLTLADAMSDINGENIHFPVIVKPRFGNGSIATMIAYNEEEMAMMFTLVERSVERSWLRYESAQSANKVIIQQMLGGNEYGLDILNHIDSGEFVHANIKQKISMRSGETDRAIVMQNSMIWEQAKKLGQLSKHLGNLDCDGFLCNGKFYILEMNARFGGGYPFSHVAGANYPRAIVAWLKGESFDPSILQARLGVEAYKNIEMCIVG